MLKVSLFLNISTILLVRLIIFYVSFLLFYKIFLNTYYNNQLRNPLRCNNSTHKIWDTWTWSWHSSQNIVEIHLIISLGFRLLLSAVTFITKYTFISVRSITRIYSGIKWKFTSRNPMGIYKKTKNEDNSKLMISLTTWYFKIALNKMLSQDELLIL